MRHTCPNCSSGKTALSGVEEGWDACGERGLHTVRRHYRCRQCGTGWQEDLDAAEDRASHAQSEPDERDAPGSLPGAPRA